MTDTTQRSSNEHPTCSSSSMLSQVVGHSTFAVASWGVLPRCRRDPLEDRPPGVANNAKTTSGTFYTVCSAMAQPHRRLVLDPVRERTRSVGDLIGELDLGQPGVSKHLKVLRVAGRERHLDPGAIP